MMKDTPAARTPQPSCLACSSSAALTGIQSRRTALSWWGKFVRIGNAYCAVGDFERAEAAFMNARAQDVEHSYYLHARLCAVPCCPEQTGEAMKAVDELVAVSLERYVPPAFVAVAYLGVEDYDEVFRWLDKESTVELAIWAILPWSDPVRSDPRFQTVLERLGLPS